MKLRFGNPDVVDYEMILYQVGNFSFAKLSRSTVPFMNFWRPSEKRICAILKELGADYYADSNLFFEYPVRSARPRAKPSFSDAMYVSPSLAIAFEGKWGEPCDTTVGKWRTRGSDRDKVLEHWLQYIRRRADMEHNIDHIPYQIVHRTASAASMPAPKAVVIYQIFFPSPDRSRPGDYAAALAEWLRCLTIRNGLEFWIHRIRATPTALFNRTHISLKGGDAPDVIRHALISGDLFEFEPEPLERIR